MRYRRLLPFLTRFNYHLGSHKLHANPADISCQPFFILGSGRNGSTLLSMILNGHSKIFLPNEQFALHYAAIRYQLYNFLIWRDLVKIIIGEFADSKNNQGWNVNFNSLYDRLYQTPKTEQSLQKIIDLIISEVAIQKGETFSLWGDKTPSTIWFLKHIYNLYPQSKFIFLVRDGRDVINSYKNGGPKLFNNLADIEITVKNWLASINKWNWLKKKDPATQLLELQYEHLISDPKNQIARVLSFLELSYEEGMLEYENVVNRTS